MGGILNRSYGYDPVNNITRITNNINTNKSQTFNYDALDRLTTATGQYGNLGYTYDAVGNRLTEKRNSTTDTYTYQTTSNKLNSITRASGNRTFAYDNAGNRTQGTAENNSNQTYTYNQPNRLTSVNINGTPAATYTHSPLGHRVMKTLANGNKEIYHYDEAGQLIAVTDALGATVREYIYWGNQQIALATNNQLYYIHNDHLNTPQVITNTTQQVVWMGDYEPFGKLATNQANSIEIFSRFPGQYFDQETNLYYNYFRDYDPSIGRYIESDPIGLEGGINTYVYVSGNPIQNIDPKGLKSLVRPFLPWIFPWLFPTPNPNTDRDNPNLPYDPYPNTPHDDGSDSDNDEFCPPIIKAEEDPLKKEKRCQALKDSILNTCYGLTPKKRMACYEAANTTYRQCMGWE